MGTIRRINWQHWLLIFGFALSLALTGFFVVRAVHFAPHIRKDEPIRPWMTIPYIAHSYRVPAHILYEALGLTGTTPDRRPLLEIARQQHRTVESIVILLQDAIIRTRLNSTPSPSATPSPPGSTS